MSNEVSDFDNWQVFEVDVSEVSNPRAVGWADATRRIANESGIPLEMRFDHENGRYFLALPTTQHYDDLIDKVDAELMRHFEDRMTHLKDRFRKQPTALPTPALE